MLAGMKNHAIGGYFELELLGGSEFHKGKVALNSGRNALKYILQRLRPSKLLLPRYLCEAVMQPVQDLDISYAFYTINEQLDPVGLDRFDTDNAVLYINYFGLKDRTVGSLAQSYKNLIIDNTQAFFAPTTDAVPAFYSARKFFGVPDGAYVGGCATGEDHLEVDRSHERFAHLLKRVELGAEGGFVDYQANEAAIASLPLQRMSRLTSRILSSINYSDVIDRRQKNYKTLHSLLSQHNLAVFADIDDQSVPMAYPFLCEDSSMIREALLRHKIFCAQLWTNVVKDLANEPNSVEYQMAKNVIPLPVDQRYNEEDMQYVASVITKVLQNG